MKRRTIHLLFAALALSCGSMAAHQTWRLHQTTVENDAIARLNTYTAADKFSAPVNPTPRVALAYANALSRSEDFDAAARTYNQLVQKDPTSQTGLAALYNLGNLYMRQGLTGKHNGKSDYLPDIELAKQRYRDVLKRRSDDWDARYNLEQALRIAPEEEAALSNGEKDIKERRRVRLRGMSAVQLP